MFIAIVGTNFSGKSTVADYLVHHKGFQLVRLLGPSDKFPEQQSSPTESTSTIGVGVRDMFDDMIIGQQDEDDRHRYSFLSMMSPISTAAPPSPAPGFRGDSPSLSHPQPAFFSSPEELLAHVTRNWLENYVTVDLRARSHLVEFATRPFFMVVSVDAPILTRYRRRPAWLNARRISLEDFVQEHDSFYYGARDHLAAFTPQTSAFGQASTDAFHSVHALANLHIVNGFETIGGLHSHLDSLDLVNPERLRPGWDSYFMQLASHASHRSNCMKRRVGAILVRNKRIVSTGYNGTPRGLKNCNEGGCTRCNSAKETPEECLCLHAEENALLEAGRDRLGDDAVLYCNTCPCLKCTIKIIQTGVKEVVYNLSYKVDDASAALFKEAGVILRRHAPPS